ncbi:PEP-CTERM sorting domain-containing protein [Aquincola sp. J276]|uniref:PEP-CTERM sorting domain-containing protein n=1 Tax=Aquincola sp. J276 TaxID=2898432 RepID=UPI002151101A|nr:PEP-CTERM sorting domain-containing protein [Aquincola sp. J276]MCR5864089.1 hypothetical protein [Aquincola sp. J276]
MRQRPIKKPRLIRMLAALAGLLSSTAYAADPEPIEHSYSVSFPIGRKDVVLRSEADCGFIRCNLTYSVTSTPIDAFIKLDWRDKNGRTLVQASSANFFGFYVEDFGNGVVEATEIRKSGLQAIVVESGTADFTGSIGGGSLPCGVSFVCPGATYHAFAGIFGGTGRLPAMAAEKPLQEVGGSIWRVGVNTGQEAQVISFNSEVHAQSGAYRYRYEVTNSSLLPLPFTWSAIGFSGVVASGQTLVLERMSELAPQLAAAQTETVFDLGFGTGETDSIVMGLETLAPVPEPGAALLLLPGLGLLALVSASRRRARAASGHADATAPAA